MLASSCCESQSPPNGNIQAPTSSFLNRNRNPRDGSPRAKILQCAAALSPLTAEEITQTSAFLFPLFGLPLHSPQLAIVSLTLWEPLKPDSLTSGPSHPFPGVHPDDRLSHAVLLLLRHSPSDPSSSPASPPSSSSSSELDQVHEVIYNITRRSLVSRERVPDVHPTLIEPDFYLVQDLVRAHPDFLRALARRGLRAEDVLIDPWSAGWFGEEIDRRGHRIVHPVLTVRMGSHADNAYAHPIEGMVPVVDLTDRTVTVLDMDDPVVPTPTVDGNFSKMPVAPSEAPDDGTTPILITQPLGPSFKVGGDEKGASLRPNFVEWQGWSFTAGWTQREGLVLQDVRFDGRPIFWRASLSEMVVPYFCPRWPHYRKNAFDSGDYGIGNLANSLRLGCDCLGEIRYFDAAMADASGRARVLKHAICMHEEDAGLLWRHTDWRLEAAGDPLAVQSARATKLIVSMWCVIGNYDYSIRFTLHQDGKFEPGVQATGLVNSSAVPRSLAASTHGQYLGDGLEAHHHQHSFSFRFDMNVDGPNNTAVELNTVPTPPHPELNKYANAAQVVATPLSSPTHAQRDVNPATARLWSVCNQDSLNRAGKPVSYALVPGPNVHTMLQSSSPVLRRAPFMKHHFFVTPFDPDQLYACGNYPNQSNPERPHPKNKLVGGDYPTDDRVSLIQTRIVAWYTLTLHHIVHLEDYPIMPTVNMAFHWQPVGFFDFNPTLNVNKLRGEHLLSKL